MSGTTPELCRVVLVTPYRTLELALPASVPLCDLVPVLVQRATTFGAPDRLTGGRGRGRRLSGEEDWVIQRLGSGPLDEELTPDGLQIRDGETLYLRPRDSQLPPAHFDDLIDGLATGVRARPDRWRESMTRGLFLALGAMTLFATLVSVLSPSFALRGPAAAVIAAFLLIGAALFSRSVGDSWAGLVSGLAALPFAGLAGYLLPGVLARSQPAPDMAGEAAPALSLWTPEGIAMAAPSLLACFAACTGATIIAMGAVGAHRPVFLSVWLTGAGGALGSALMIFGFTPAQAAAAVVTLVLITSTFAPSLAFRLARLRLPQLPTGAADLSEDIEPYPAPELMAGAALADIYLTAMLVAAGIIATVSTLLLVEHGGGVAFGMVIALAAILLIRSRSLTSAWQRIATLMPPSVGLVLLAVHMASRPDSARRLLALTALLFLAGVLLAVSRVLPGRRLLPSWGRLADILEYLAAGAVIVLLAVLLDAFQWARALAG